MKKYLHHFLSQTVHLLLFFMIGVSVLSILLPWFEIEFDYVTWGNLGGFSIVCDIIFIERFFFNKRYCRPARYLPISMLLVNALNIISNEFFPKYYGTYGKWYEITIFSVTLLICAIISIDKTLKK